MPGLCARQLERLDSVIRTVSYRLTVESIWEARMELAETRGRLSYSGDWGVP